MRSAARLKLFACVTPRKTSSWRIVIDLLRSVPPDRLVAVRSAGPVGGHRLQRILFQCEHVLGHDAIGPLAGSRLAIELLVGQADERADKAGALGEPLRNEAFHRRRRDPRFVACFKYLSGVDLLVVDVIRNQRPGVLALGTAM